MDDRLKLRLSGPPTITRGDASLTESLPGKAQAILYYLMVTGQAQNRVTLAGLLWGDLPEAKARSNLRRALVDLRQSVGDFLTIERQSVGFAADSDVWADVVELTTGLATALSPLDAGRLRQAVELYRGDFLTGFYVREAPDFESWAAAERERLRELVIQALYTLADYHTEQDEWPQGLAAIRRVLALEPWREEAHRQLMLLLARSGQRSAALAQFEICRQVLEEELGVEPGAETRTLYERIRDEDLSRAGKIAPQIEAAGASPTPSVTEVPPHNLPHQTTPFVGRATEVAELNRLLAEPTLRLVTILGPGGIGKTRLAQEVAATHLTHFAHGVYFVSLAPIEATESLAPTIAEALGFSFYEGATPQQQLLDYLHSKTMLLILDNFEHLLSGAGLVADILRTAPEVKILATSRERLKLRDEQLFHLAGIDFPAPETPPGKAAAETSAVQLFLESARRVQPGFTLDGDDLTQVAGICHLVQGMPLAILLAAAWVEMLTPAEIAVELDQSLDLLETEMRDVPDRHHSMRAVFDHSWGLLSEPERETFQQLSVFRGGFTWQAAQEVAGASLKVLRDLLNKSLLQPAASGRYQLHELLRQYAAEKLEQTPLAYQAARDRHCAHYTALLNEWEDEFAGPRQQLALAEVEGEIKNVRSAWNWAVRQGKLDEIDLALESLYQFYWIRSRFQEGQEAFTQAAERLQAGEAVPAENVLTRLLARQGAFCYSLGHHDTAEALLQTSLTTARRLDANKEIAFSLRLLGDVAGDLAEYQMAQQRFQESMTISQETGNQADLAAALFGLGLVIYNLAEFSQARDCYQESLTLYRTLGYQLGIARVLDKLGMIAFAEGQYSESEQYYLESIALFKEVGDQLGIAQTLGGLGLAAWVQGEARLVEAKQLFEESLAICGEIGHRFMTVVGLAWLGQINNGAAAYQAAQQHFRKAVALSREIGLRETLAWSLNGLGEAACGLGDFRSARHTLSESLTIALDIQNPFDALEALAYWATLLTKEDHLAADPDPAGAVKTEHVLELLALAINHPANLQYVRDKAARLMADLSAELPPDIVAAAQARGQARDLWATAEAALAEIQAGLAGFANKDEDFSPHPNPLVEKPLRVPKERGLASVPPHTLRVPSSPTPLIGREKELTDISDLLADPDCRLLTLVGPGGIGKTRLAVEAAQQALAQFTDGVYFVSLAATDSVEDILPRIAAVVDPETYPTGQTAADFLPQLRQRDPALLLVLDNLEQLLPDGSAAIEDLLTQTHQLKLIVTSREALNLRWEWRYDLDGLAYPSDETADALESYSAVEMFLERMRRTRRMPLTEAEVEAAAQICRLVGGMPLGIELAATQASHLPVTAIATALERNLDALVVSLRDLPARQHSLRASFEVTWANLSPDEQAVFRRLSLFRSSFTPAAAQAVAESGPLALINLIDKSLLRQILPERYDLHPVLRHFAKEKLAEVPDEEAQTLAHYRDYYTAFLRERTEALQQETNLTKNITEFYSEIDNLWAGWARISGQDGAQDYATALIMMLDLANHAQFAFTPNALVIYEHRQRTLERRSSEADVCLIDMIWTSTLADHLLDLSDDLGDEALTHFSTYVENNIEAGRLVALPFLTDLGLLYYRADLLAKYGFAEPPATWDELELMAAEIQAGQRTAGRVDFWGYIWQGENFEGLTCNALEWQVSHGGGRLIEPEGVITVNNPRTVAAFERAARWVGTISPLTVTETGSGDERTNQKTWQAGKAAFMRSWAGYLPERIDQPTTTKDRIGITLLPSGGAGQVATLGGQQIAISKYARHPRAAIELVRHAISQEAQLQRALSRPFWLPTTPDLYDHPQVVAIQPHLYKIKEIFSGNIVARPSKVCGKLYPQVSKAYSTAVHSILTGQVEAATAVAELEARLVEITGFRVGRPVGFEK